MLRQSEPNQVVVRHHWLADYTISFGLLGKKLMVPSAASVETRNILHSHVKSIPVRHTDLQFSLQGFMLIMKINISG